MDCTILMAALIMCTMLIAALIGGCPGVMILPVPVAKAKSAEERRNSANDDNPATTSSSGTKAPASKKKSSSRKKEGGKKGEAPESMHPPPGPLVALGRPKDKAHKRPRSVVMSITKPLPLLGAQTVTVILCVCVIFGRING